MKIAPIPRSGIPERSSPEPDHSLEVDVIFTSDDATVKALKRASALARSLCARIVLIVPQVVPYPLPLGRPDVPIDFNHRRLLAIAAEARTDVSVRVYLCRDRLRALGSVLKPRSLVVVGGPIRWWPTAASTLAERLRRAGHEVVFTEVKSERRVSW